MHVIAKAQHFSRTVLPVPRAMAFAGARAPPASTSTRGSSTTITPAGQHQSRRCCGRISTGTVKQLRPSSLCSPAASASRHGEGSSSTSCGYPPHASRAGSASIRSARPHRGRCSTITAASEPGSPGDGGDDFWSSKPSWCQPYTIVPFGLAVVYLAYQLLGWLGAVLAAMPIGLWWYTFLLLVPQMYREQGGGAAVRTGG